MPRPPISPPARLPARRRKCRGSACSARRPAPLAVLRGRHRRRFLVKAEREVNLQAVVARMAVAGAPCRLRAPAGRYRPVQFSVTRRFANVPGARPDSPARADSCAGFGAVLGNRPAALPGGGAWARSENNKERCYGFRRCGYRGLLYIGFRNDRRFSPGRALCDGAVRSRRRTPGARRGRRRSAPAAGDARGERRSAAPRAQPGAVARTTRAGRWRRWPARRIVAAGPRFSRRRRPQPAALRGAGDDRRRFSPSSPSGAARSPPRSSRPSR